MSKKSNKEDLTRIEDLSEFLHQEDPETDSLFDDEPPPIETIGAQLANLDDLDNLEEDEESEDFNNFQEFNPNLEVDNDNEVEDQEDDNFPGLPVEDEDDGFPEFESEEIGEVEQLEENEDNFPDFATEETDDEDYESEEEQDDFPVFEEEESDNTDFTLQGDDLETEDLEEEFDAAQDLIQPIDDEIIFEESQEQISDNSPREDFKDIKDFAKNISYGNVQVGGNPAFSILLKDLLSEDVHDSILAILNEHGLVGENEALFKQSMNLGNLLIAQISEYSAVYLASKLRKYCADIQVGLSEDIHPSRSYEIDNKGLVTKRSIFQNKDKKYKKAEHKFSIEDLLISKQHQISGTIIVEHIGVITTTRLVSLGDLTEQTAQLEASGELSDLKISSTEIYELMIKTLKEQAFEKGANAILSVSHTLNPVLNHQEEDGDLLYQLQCSGDAVIIEKNG